MYIPSGTDYPSFYRAARKQGIRIRSKFTSVEIYTGHRSDVLFWIAQIGRNKKEPHYMRKLFPFSEKGEMLAAQAVEARILEFGLRRYKPKRRD